MLLGAVSEDAESLHQRFKTITVLRAKFGRLQAKFGQIWASRFGAKLFDSGPLGRLRPHIGRSRSEVYVFWPDCVSLISAARALGESTSPNSAKRDRGRPKFVRNRLGLGICRAISTIWARSGTNVGLHAETCTTLVPARVVLFAKLSVHRKGMFQPAQPA